jgi:O-antigen ligase
MVFWLPMAALLAAGTLSTKAAGAFWLGLVLMGLWAWVVRRAPAQEDSPETGLALRLATIWFLSCALAFVLKAIPVVYWQAPWEERHAELRLLIGAAGGWLVMRYLRHGSDARPLIGHGLALACVLALVLVLTRTSDAAPTNRIPWAAGVSLVTCTLLCWSRAAWVSVGQARTWLFASFLGLVAVAFSGVRGSYLLIVLWPALLVGLHLSQPRGRPQGSRRWLLVLAVAAVVAGVNAKLPEGFSPVHRIRAAIAEARMLDPNTANGARLAMWAAGAASFSQHPILGIGHAGGKSLLKETAEKKQSHEIARLGHFHSDYMHPAVEFGLFGLASYLCFAVGLAFMAALAWYRRAPVTALGLTGLLAMHASSGMSNVNFAHNYYPTVLSLCVTLVLIACARDGSPAPQDAPVIRR